MNGLLLTLALMCVQEKDASVAMVLKVSANATVQRDQELPRRLEKALFLRAGDRLTVEDGIVVLYFHKQGRQELFKGPTKAVLTATGSDPAGEVLRKSDTDAVRKGINHLHPSGRTAGVILRTMGPEKLPPVTPILGASVVSDRPTLAWRSEAGAVKFRVTLLDSAGEILWRHDTAAPQLSYPAKEKALVPKTEYRWRVLGLDVHEKKLFQWQSTFYVLGQEHAKDQEDLRVRGAGNDPTDLLLVGLASFGHGLHDQALAVFERLVRLAPKDPIPHAFLAAMYERAGRTTDAHATWTRARELGYVDPAEKEKVKQ